MIILHKGKRTDNGKEVIGYVHVMWGDYYITCPDNENTAYHVEADTIEPIIHES